MSDKTKIEWADATVNAINGCSVTSPGCTHCYAMKLAGTRMKTHPTREGLTIESKAGPVWNGQVRLHEPALLQPLAWKKPRHIFWNAHGDTFHDAVPDEWIDRVFAVAALTPQHTHMILTKRSKRMRHYLSRHRWHLWAAIGRAIDAKRWCNLPPVIGGDHTPLPNLWLGVSVEDQTRADERIPDLLATPAAVRFLSCEPLLGPLDIEEWLHDSTCIAWPGTCICSEPREVHIDWVIAGGESGPGAHPMHPDWARSLRDQCSDAGVPFHFKQWGEWLPWSQGCLPEWESQSGLREDRHTLFPGDIDRDPRWDDGIWAIPGHEHFAFQRVSKKRAGRLLDGVEHNGMPGAAK